MAEFAISGMFAGRVQMREPVLPFEALCIAAIVALCWINAVRFIV